MISNKFWHFKSRFFEEKAPTLVRQPRAEGQGRQLLGQAAVVVAEADDRGHGLWRELDPDVSHHEGEEYGECEEDGKLYHLEKARVRFETLHHQACVTSGL